MSPVTVYVEENNMGFSLFLAIQIPYLGIFPLVNRFTYALIKGRDIGVIHWWEYVISAVSLLLLFILIKYRNHLFPPLYITFSDANIVAFLRRRHKPLEILWTDMQSIAIKPTEIHLQLHGENAEPVIVRLPSYKVGKEVKQVVRDFAAGKHIPITV